MSKSGQRGDSSWQSKWTKTVEELEEDFQEVKDEADDGCDGALKDLFGMFIVGVFFVASIAEVLT